MKHCCVLFIGVAEHLIVGTDQCTTSVGYGGLGGMRGNVGKVSELGRVVCSTSIW
jgi:hypothetical protein